MSNREVMVVWLYGALFGAGVAVLVVIALERVL